jgi:hypothetical protein
MNEKYITELEKHIEELKDKYGHFEVENIALDEENKILRKRSPNWIPVPNSKSEPEAYHYVLGTVVLAVVYLEYNKSKSWTTQINVGKGITKDYQGFLGHTKRMVENFFSRVTTHEQLR